MKKIILLSCFYLLGIVQTFGQIMTEMDLINAITGANGSTTITTITIDADITLTSALPSINRINAGGALLEIKQGNGTIINGNSLFRVLNITLGNVKLTNLTIKGGSVSGADGGGILNNGTLTLNNCIISNNIVLNGNGGGIANNGTLTIKNSTIHSNNITGTSGTFRGAGIYHSVAGSLLNMSYCTVSGNSFSNFAIFQGAGIYLGNNTFTIDNSTIAYNKGVNLSSTNGGGIYAENITSTEKISNCIILGNEDTMTGINDFYKAAGGNIITVKNTLINSAGTNISSMEGAINATVTNIISSTLTDNGGFTPTHALLANNANLAIEGGSLIVAGETDQRGESLLGNNKDIGAYEFGTFWVTTATDNNLNPLLFSLREAITATNVNFSATPLPSKVILNTTQKRIKFAIPSPFTITLTGFALPTITKPVIIDGTTQIPTNTRINLINASTAGICWGLDISADNCEVYGLNLVGFGTVSAIPCAGLSGGIRINGNAANPIINCKIGAGGNQRNVIQQCNYGVYVDNATPAASFGATDNVIINGNFIGINAGGDIVDNTTRNTNAGIYINHAEKLLITSGNISGNSHGVLFGGLLGSNVQKNVVIDNNRIGVAENLTALPNSNGVGIHTNSQCDGDTISNNIIGGSIGDGIAVITSTKDLTIRYNYIGVNTLTTPLPNNRGIQVQSGVTGLFITNNAISGNTKDGISIDSPITTFINNKIGTNFAGNTAVANGGNGITLLAGATGLTIGGAAGQENIISGNAQHGIQVNADNVTIQNNYIGTTLNGFLALPNSSLGIGFNAINISSTPLPNQIKILNNLISGNTNNGIVAGGDFGAVGTRAWRIEDNVIGLNTAGAALGNKLDGISLSFTNTPITTAAELIIKGNTICANGSSAINNGLILDNVRAATITGNFIGTNGAGNSGLGNIGIGMRLSTGCTGLTVGDATAGQENIISGNATGIVIDAGDVTIQNNYIGTNAGGTWAVGNINNGINILNGGSMIQSNIISGNATGISINASSTTVTNNKIGLGFDTALNDIAIPNTIGINIVTGFTNINSNSFAATSIGVSSASPCIIANNTFGTSHNGMSALTNFGILPQPTFATQAISLASTATSSMIDNNVICGAANTTPKTIAGNTVIGSAEAILIASSDIQVINNKIGITSNNIAIPNDIGVSTKATTTTNNCFIGNLGQGNIISNNKNAAIYLASKIAFTNPISINYNRIGTDSLGTTLSDSTTIIGIAAEDSASVGIDNYNIINNTRISAISLRSIRNTINNTIIGNLNPDPITNPSFNTVAGINVTSGCTIGADSIQNCAGIGVQILGSSNTLYFNTIFNNKKQGVNIKNGNGNRLNENSIYNNGGTATPNPKGIDLNLPTAPIQGNNAQPAPIITSATILPGNQMDISGTASPDGSHFLQFYRTTTTDVGGNADLVEGKDYIGQPPMGGIVTVTNGFWATTINTLNTLSPALSSTDFITVNTQYSPAMSIFNSSEFSTPYLLCSTTITSITTQNIRTTCAGSLTDVRINLTTTTNVPNKFDVNIDGDPNDTYEYTNIDLQSDANGKFLLLRDVSGIRFDNPKLLDQFANCISAAFATPNPIIIQNSALPRPTIISARTVQSTSCTTPNGQLIVKIQNGVIGQNYELSTNGVLGAEYSVLFLGTDSTLRVTLGLNENIRDLQVYQAGNQCVSTTFPFSSQMVAPLQNIDSTRNVVVVIDEISPNFNTVVSLINAQDSISYRLFNRTLGKFVGIAQQGNNSTLNFNTDTLQQTGNYIYEIVATSIRTGCSRSLAKTVIVKVISGILPEELDILREVYTSTNGNFWTTKWDFTKDISTFLGVSVFGGRVKTILLPSNNLSGKLTTKVLNLRKLGNLDIGNNSLDFGSVEPFVNRTFAFNYKIQANINRQIDTTAYANTKMELAVITAGTQNKYQWTKDNVVIPNANLATLTFDALKLTDAGLYTCLISNTLGTELTLERRTIRLRVNSRNISVSDSTLLIRINDELGGGNWTNKWDRSKPVAEWYGITMTGDKITSINLANNNLVGVIPNIIPLTTNILSDLTYLNLSGNRITGEIPKSLGNLSKLQYLDLSNNLLVGDVILELGKLQDLKNLLLSYNTFKTVHEDLGKLIKLENLFLNNNSIAIIPAEIGNLKALQTLNFSNNLLKTIPTNLGLLTNLVTLGLANNQLTSVADIFNNLQSLQDLSLQNNELTALPASFIRLRNLKTLLLHTNFLDFADFELLATLPILNATGAVYEPQAKVGTNQDILFTLDQALNLMQNVNGTANTFQWFKNGVAIGVSTNPLRTNAIYLADAGVYTLQIQNTIARKLTLVSYDIVVKVSCGNATSVRINTVGTSRYCEGETINTLLSADVNPDVQVVGYQWFRDNSRLNGENQKNLSIIQEGLYSLQVSDKNNCAFLSKPIAIQVLPKPRINVVRKGDTLTVNTTQSNGKLQYVWYKDNTQILDAKTTSIVARANGTYYVIVTDSTSCPTKSPIINLTITGIEDDIAAELAKQITVYPNPTEAKITVILPENFAISKLKIYNMLGQVVLENSQKQIIDNIKNFDNKSNSLIINIENFVSGSYLLELQNEKGTVIRKKLVKQ